MSRDQMSDAPSRAEEGDVAVRLLASVGGRDAFYRSFDARSHFPERLAASTLAGAVSLYEDGAQAILAAGGDESIVADWQARFMKLWAAYQHAGGRVMSWFITGPANFPVERNRKRMDVERRRGDEFLAHAKGASEFARRRLRSAERAALSAAAATMDHAETGFPGGRLVRNATLDRIQLVFDGRPDAETITDLKSRAFRWSPREGAWQRQLTRNGVWAAEAVIRRLTEATGQQSEAR